MIESQLMQLSFVIPAKAGIQSQNAQSVPWTPALREVTVSREAA